MSNQPNKPLPCPWQDKSEADRIALLQALFRTVPQSRDQSMK